MQARQAAGLSQAEAIRYTGNVIAKSALSLAERERREMQIDKLKRLAGLYGVRTEWLVTGAGPRMLNDPDEGEASEPDETPASEAPEEPMELLRPRTQGKRRRHPKRA